MKKLNVYLSDLYVSQAILHNVHWNVEGLSFKTVHEYIESVYNQFFDYFDDIAEYQRMIGKYPMARAVDFVENATVKDIESKAYSCKEAVEITLDLVKHMKKAAEEIHEEADDYILEAMLEDQIAAYRKDIWFLSMMTD